MANKSTQDIKEEINVRLPDNQEQLIDPEDLRTVLHDIADSYYNNPSPVIPQGTVTGATNLGEGVGGAVGVYDSTYGSTLNFRSIASDPNDTNPVVVTYDTTSNRILLKAPLPITLREPTNIISHPFSNTANLINTEEIIVYTFSTSEEEPYDVNYIQVCVNGEEIPNDSDHIVYDSGTRQIKLKTGPVNIKYRLEITDEVFIRIWR